MERRFKMLDIESSTLGLDIEHRLLDMRMTKTEFAARLGITPQYLWDILRGHRPALAKKKEIAALLDSLEKSSA
jgi:transcriptional regulator with XRE-family HTH domain